MTQDNTRPRFSIVIPTRNRGALLGGALKSALAQTFDDYEIVVMANYPRDNTRQVVEALATDRVHYFETDEPLNMAANWEMAWSKARGEYVMFLCDDDALVPEALQLIQSEALQGNPPVVTWQDGLYYFSDYNDRNVQNVLLLFDYGEQLLTETSTRPLRENCAKFKFGWNDPLPRMANTAANREFFEAWRQKLGGLFFPIAPDYSFAWIALHICESVRTFNRPLTLHGVSDHGTGLGLGVEGLRFIGEFAPDINSEAPVNIPLAATNVASTFMRVSGRLREAGVTSPQLDWSGYFVALSEQLVAARDLTDKWDRLANNVLETAGAVSPGVVSRVEYILAQPSPTEASSETLRELRDRTGRMAAEYAGSLPERSLEYAGDEECAACTLGLNRSVLAHAAWRNIYVFGEEAGFDEPYGAGLVTTGYYDLLRRCRAKKQASVAQPS